MRITLDNLDQAIEELEKLEHRIREFPVEVAKESANRIRYDQATPYLIRMEGESRIMNSGDQIAFQEFGAGFSAQEFDYESFHTDPGAWSKDHKRTYQNWKGDAEDYPYNRPAQRLMQKEAERLANETERKAAQYFGN